MAEDVSSGSFDDAVERVRGRTGARVAKRQAENLARRAAVDFEAFYAARPVNDVTARAELPILLSFDGAGIVMRTEDLRPATRREAEKQEADPRWPSKRLSKGQKKNRKRMAQVAAVYESERFVRTAEDILHELRPVKDATEKRPRPKPVDKRVWASVEHEAGEVIADAFDEAERRDPEHKMPWVVLVDGNATQLQSVYLEAARRKVEITVILDIIHVLEYLWKASYCFHKDGSKAAEEWVHKRLLMLLSGGPVAPGRSRSAPGGGPAAVVPRPLLPPAEVGGQCVAGFACSGDHMTFLRCEEGTMVVQGLCRGAHHCQVQEGLVRCDQSIADIGDACDGSGAACSLDGINLLECRNGRRTLKSACTGGCEVHRKSVQCVGTDITIP